MTTEIDWTHELAQACPKCGLVVKVKPKRNTPEAFFAAQDALVARFERHLTLCKQEVTHA